MMITTIINTVLLIDLFICTGFNVPIDPKLVILGTLLPANLLASTKETKFNTMKATQSAH